MNEAAREPVRQPRRLSGLQRDDWIVMGWVMAIKILLFVLAVKSYPIFWNRYLNGLRQWFEIWNHWDALHYQQIAQFGYAATGVTKSFLSALAMDGMKVISLVNES